MTFNADYEFPSLVKRNFYRWILISSLIFTIYGGLLLTYVFYTSGVVGFLVMLLAAIILGYRNIILRLMAQFNIISHFITSIEINNNEITFTTLRVSLFFDFISRESMEVKIENEPIRFIKANEKYGSKKYTGQCYLLINRMEEYAIAEKFFADFESLIDEIRSYVNNQNEI